MKHAIQAAITFSAIALGGAAQASPERDLAHAKSLLTIWEGTEVSLEDGTLTAVYEDEISGEMYLAIIGTYLCSGLIIGKTLESVTTVEILDNEGEAGFVYKKGMEDCQTFLDRPAGAPETRHDILEATHVKSAE
jgi:hypothetical protein